VIARLKNNRSKQGINFDSLGILVCKKYYFANPALNQKRLWFYGLVGDRTRCPFAFGRGKKALTRMGDLYPK